MTNQKLFEFYDRFNKAYRADNNYNITRPVINEGLKSHAIHVIIIKRFHEIKLFWDTYTPQQQRSVTFLYNIIRGNKQLKVNQHTINDLIGSVNRLEAKLDYFEGRQNEMILKMEMVLNDS